MFRLLSTLAVPLVFVTTPQSAAAEPAQDSTRFEWAADTTFAPEGNYTLEVTVSGQALTMTFVVTRKPDGTLSGIFKSMDIGDYATTSFKLEGRTMTLTIDTDGGPGMVVLTVKPDQTVEGEWSGAGDGSKIKGKKVS